MIAKWPSHVLSREPVSIFSLCHCCTQPLPSLDKHNATVEITHTVSFTNIPQPEYHIMFIETVYSRKALFPNAGLVFFSYNRLTTAREPPLAAVSGQCDALARR